MIKDHIINLWKLTGAKVDYLKIYMAKKNGQEMQIKKIQKLMTRTFKSFCICTTLQKSNFFAEWTNLYSCIAISKLSHLYTDRDPPR